MPNTIQDIEKEIKNLEERKQELEQKLKRAPDSVPLKNCLKDLNDRLAELQKMAQENTTLAGVVGGPQPPNQGTTLTGSEQAIADYTLDTQDKVMDQVKDHLVKDLVEKYGESWAGVPLASLDTTKSLQLGMTPFTADMVIKGKLEINWAVESIKGEAGVYKDMGLTVQGGVGGAGSIGLGAGIGISGLFTSKIVGATMGVYGQIEASGGSSISLKVATDQQGLTGVGLEPLKIEIKANAGFFIKLSAIFLPGEVIEEFIKRICTFIPGAKPESNEIRFQQGDDLVLLLYTLGTIELGLRTNNGWGIGFESNEHKFEPHPKVVKFISDRLEAFEKKAVEIFEDIMDVWDSITSSPPVTMAVEATVDFVEDVQYVAQEIWSWFTDDE